MTELFHFSLEKFCQLHLGKSFLTFGKTLPHHPRGNRGNLTLGKLPNFQLGNFGILGGLPQVSYAVSSFQIHFPIIPWKSLPNSIPEKYFPNFSMHKLFLTIQLSLGETFLLFRCWIFANLFEILRKLMQLSLGETIPTLARENHSFCIWRESAGLGFQWILIVVCSFSWQYSSGAASLADLDCQRTWLLVDATKHFFLVAFNYVIKWSDGLDNDGSIFYVSN